MKKRTRPSAVVRLAGRLAFVGIGGLVCTLTLIQYGRILNENLILSRSLSDVRNDVRALKERKRDDQNQIHRLRDPAGAVPDIHDRLHLIGPNEAIIYLRPSPPHPKDR